METYILADNQDITRQGLISFLRRLDYELPDYGQPGRTISRPTDGTGIPDGGPGIVTAASCAELSQRLKDFPHSAVVLDYTLFDFSSASQLLNMKSGARESSWLLFSDELGEAFLRRVLLADPTVSVAMKRDNLEQIAEALRIVSEGGVYLCDTARSILEGGVPKATAPEKLTAAETAILREIALGKMTKEIAWEKNLSFHTVNTHRRNIFRKLEINSVHEATRYAIRAGLVDMSEYYI